MPDIEAARSTAARLPHRIDAKRRDELVDLFAAEVDVGYTSLFGGTAQRSPRRSS